jgi:ADP-dependent NAD(P)H-hydrate dehydratase / NAD(P)H-hydrate epimerase
MSLQKQDSKKPLFPDLIWSRPENKRSAGKLLIIGGQAGDFINVSSAYTFAKEAGAGTIKLILPESLKKIASNIEGVEYAPSNSSGSFAKTALASFFDLSEWSDHVLLAGDFGKNAETTVILDGFLLRGSRPVTVSQNALSSIGISLVQLVNMPANIIIDKKTFQKIGISTGSHVAITSTINYAQMGGIIESISAKTKAKYTIIDEDHTWCAFSGEVISTQTKPKDINAMSAYSAVWLMQNPSKPLEALTTGVNQASNI